MTGLNGTCDWSNQHIFHRCLSFPSARHSSLCIQTELNSHSVWSIITHISEDTALSFKTFVTVYQTTQCHIQETLMFTVTARRISYVREPSICIRWVWAKWRTLTQTTATRIHNSNYMWSHPQVRDDTGHFLKSTTRNKCATSHAHSH
jgi:hypothetical protein